MVGNMMAHIKVIRKMDMEHLHGPIKINILEVGIMANNMEKVNWSNQMEILLMVFGPKDP